MKYRCYPEYKDSGVAWLGEVPAHWEVRRLKFVARYQNSNVDKKSYEGQKNVRLCNYTDVYYNEKITNNMDFMVATATDAEIKSMSLKEGDVVITKDSEDPTDIGVPALVSEPLDNVVCGYHLTVLRANNQDAARYLHRAIQSHPTRAHFFVESPGVTRFGLNQDAIGGLVMPVPPIVERKKIAAFLDEKTTQIDQLIEKKTRFIELLKEKRAALITEAVTGKFDVRTGKPYAEYKDSGVAWLGEVPGHWEVRRLKFVARYQNSNVDKKSYEGQKNVRLCNYTDVYYNEKITNNMDFMVATATNAEIKSMSLKEGDVVITKDSEDPTDIGVPALVSEPLDNVVCGYHLTVLRAKDPDAARYLHRAIQSHPTRAHFFVESPGVTRFGLNQDAIGGLVMPVPPISERKCIADFINHQTSQIDQLIEKKARFIELLKEKRAALITEAVTGKFDVRTGKPYSEYKDSGVEWLGEVPAHWAICQQKRAWESSEYGISESIRDEGDIKILRMSCIAEGKIDFDKSGNASSVDESLLLRKGDILFNRTNSIDQIAKVGLLHQDPERPTSYASYLVRIRANRLMHNSYYIYVVNSKEFLEYARRNAIPAIGQANLSPSRYGQIRIPFPPKKEQKEITEYLQREVANIEEISDKTQQSIDLLKEKRAALITAAVTGKIDVRNWNTEAA